MTPEEQERLERFLEWRRVEGRGPRSHWRRVAWIGGTVGLGVTLALGAPLLIAPLPPDVATSERERLATHQSSAPRERPAGPGPAPASPAPASSESALVGESVSVGESASVGQSASLETAPVERAPAETQRPGLPERVAREDAAATRFEIEVWGPRTADEILTALKRPSVPPRRPVARMDQPVERPSDPAAPETSPAPSETISPAAPPVPAAPAPLAPPPASAPPAPPASSGAASVTSPAASRASSPPRAALSTPSPVAPASRVSVPVPEVATKPLPQPLEALRQPLERLKRWAEHAPEVRVGKAIVRWVRSQPADPEPPQPELRSPQSR